MKIANHDLDDSVYIIAEVGNCHEGDVDLAERLVFLAAEAGANAVKFQTIVPERLVAASEVDRLRQLRKFQLFQADFERLAAAAGRAGVHFLSTPFDCDSVRMLDPLVPAFKVASSDNTFFPLLDAVAATGKPVLLSTGLANISAIRRSLARIREVWASMDIAPQVALLHCVAAYPVPDGDANLLFMHQLSTLGARLGYSDHTKGIHAALLSVALGARIIEKHFTISKSHSEFRDHGLAADPEEFRQLVRAIRQAEEMLGREEVEVSPSEEATSVLARRSICARRDLPPGHALEPKDLDWLRPGTGLPPGREGTVLGRRLCRGLRQGEQIMPDDMLPT